jgi:hypothetical protein
MIGELNHFVGRKPKRPAASSPRWLMRAQGQLATFLVSLLRRRGVLKAE